MEGLGEDRRGGGERGVGSGGSNALHILASKILTETHLKNKIDHGFV